MAHVVICTETWTEQHLRSTGKTEEKETRYAWISSKPLTEKNVFSRCTNIARGRWRIENNFLVEKHLGYFFEHCYSYNWSAMKGFHYLMKIAHALNELLFNSELVSEHVESKGKTGFIRYLWLAFSGAVLSPESIRAAAGQNFLWRLNKENIFKEQWQVA